MAKLRHIAIATRDPGFTANFYKKHFGMKEAGVIENDLGEGFYLTDGVMNLAVIKKRGPWTNLADDDPDFIGIDHFGFVVDDLEETMQLLKEDGSREVADLYQGVGEETVYYERKFLAPDDVVIDVSEEGWVGSEKEL